MKILIIGGAGFIGCNAVKKFMERGDEVIVFDNLSRKGAQSNLEWLREKGKFEFIKGDIRNFNEVKMIFLKNKDTDVVIHLAAQVAVTTSMLNPREDFEINALGTLNILEAIREIYSSRGKGESQVTKDAPMVIYSSTNKVYGKMKDVEVIENNGRYEYKEFPNGVPESRLLDFHSPYGCSKGAADQYVIDYSRIYGLKTVSFRQSCIYGYRQFGVEDQGWVAWFTIASVLDQPITIYGDGKQVRDVLFIDDLMGAYIRAIENINKINGKAYNIGGGAENRMSLLELIALLENLLGRTVTYFFDDWRPGDQPVYISDITKITKDLGWQPSVNSNYGVKMLYDWVIETRDLISKLFF
jgi:CDP-paratose 2-epimerase